MSNHRTDSTQNLGSLRSMSLRDSLAIEEVLVKFLPSNTTILLTLDEERMDEYSGYLYGKSLSFGVIKVPKKVDSILVVFEATMFSLEGHVEQQETVERILYRFDTSGVRHYNFFNHPWD